MASQSALDNVDSKIGVIQRDLANIVEHVPLMLAENITGMKGRIELMAETLSLFERNVAIGDISSKIDKISGLTEGIRSSISLLEGSILAIENKLSSLNEIETIACLLPSLESKMISQSILDKVDSKIKRDLVNIGEHLPSTLAENIAGMNSRIEGMGRNAVYFQEQGCRVRG